MATRPGSDKRRKELVRQEHQKEKAAKRAQRKLDKENRPALAEGEDPDLAGIVAGPQPPLEDFTEDDNGSAADGDDAEDE